jgi:DNA gyrase/topoisomerase IV subunit A
MIVERTLKDIIDKDFKSYAMYVLQSRALPSAIDGQKIVGRKLIYSMLRNHKTGKAKIAEVSGSLSAVNYAHGEASAASACINMAAPYKNLLPIFEHHGSFGSRLVQESASPRYIYASLSETFKKYFADSEVLPQNMSIDDPEPAHYLPIIPWALVNGSEGIAVGYKHNVLPRSIKDITKAVKACMKDSEKFLSESKPIIPTFADFKGTVEHVEDNKYTTTGIVKYIGKYTFEVSELPIGYDRAAYVQLLADMEEKGLIKGFSDECSKAGFCFHVKVSVTTKDQIEKDPIKFFKLQKSHTELWNLIGINGKLIQFKGPHELVKYFIDYRIEMCGKKIKWEIKDATDKVKRLNWRKNFIQAIIDKEVVPSGMKKVALEAWITRHIDDSDDARKLAGIPLYACTIDEVEKLKEEIMVNFKEIDVLMKTEPHDRYESMLQSL